MKNRIFSLFFTFSLAFSVMPIDAMAAKGTSATHKMQESIKIQKSGASQVHIKSAPAQKQETPAKQNKKKTWKDKLKWYAFYGIIGGVIGGYVLAEVRSHMLEQPESIAQFRRVETRVHDEKQRLRQEWDVLDVIRGNPQPNYAYERFPENPQNNFIDAMVWNHFRNRYQNLETELDQAQSERTQRRWSHYLFGTVAPELPHQDPAPENPRPQPRFDNPPFERPHFRQPQGRQNRPFERAHYRQGQEFNFNLFGNFDFETMADGLERFFEQFDHEWQQYAQNIDQRERERRANFERAWQQRAQNFHFAEQPHFDRAHFDNAQREQQRPFEQPQQERAQDRQNEQPRFDEAQQHQPEIRDHYAVLGIDRNATRAQIIRAYRDLALIFHPDRYEANQEQLRARGIHTAQQAEQRMAEINEARDVLLGQQ